MIIYKHKYKNGIAKVMSNHGLWNFVDKKDHLISKHLWFTDVTDIENGYARVQRMDGKWNFIDKNGKILSPNRWFEFVNKFDGIYANVRVSKMGDYNLLTRAGHLLCKTNFKYIGEFRNGRALVSSENRQYNFINKKGELLSPSLWFDTIDIKFANPIGFVGDKKFFLDKTNNLHRFII